MLMNLIISISVIRFKNFALYLFPYIKVAMFISFSMYSLQKINKVQKMSN